MKLLLTPSLSQKILEPIVYNRVFINVSHYITIHVMKKIHMIICIRDKLLFFSFLLSMKKIDMTIFIIFNQ